jgi:hypothetical protein
MNIPQLFSHQRAVALLSAGLLLTSTAAEAAKSGSVRPALLTQGPKSLINVLSAERLLKKGQGDAVVKFDFYVDQFGDPDDESLITYGGSENSHELSEELVQNLGRARFIPANYYGENCGAYMTGTLVFAVSGGKPRLRIFLNQEQDRLTRGEDFIAPQQLFPINSKFRRYDDKYWRTFSTIVAVRIDTDASGKLLGAKLLRQHPPNTRKGAEIMENVPTATFSPGYLNGRPVACSTTWTIPLATYGYSKRWIDPWGSR